MNWLEALVLGLVQGLTEFLPVSSSGHLEIGKTLFGIKGEENLIFSVVVHGATVFSTIIVFRKEIWKLIVGGLKFKLNEETHYIFKIAVSMIPVGIVGLFFKDYIEGFFSGDNIAFVGAMLLVTALLLAFSFFFKSKEKKITYLDAFIIGIAQSIAVLPGISRSGSTIATGLMLRNSRTEVAKFSFLMVLIPILGENFLSLIDGSIANTSTLSIEVLIIGFIAAFLSGLFACKFMLKIVQKGKLIWFALYCAVVGLVTIFFF